MKRFIWVAGAAVLAGYGSANFSVYNRYSSVNAEYLCGYGPDVYQDALTVTHGLLEQVGSTSTVDTRMHTDEYLGNWWTAVLNWDVNAQYSVYGSLANATKIVASGQNIMSSAVIGPATSGLASGNPGSLLRLSFNVPVAQDFWFSGALAQSGPANRNEAVVKIMKDDGTGFVNYILRIAQNNSFSDMIHLQAGNYLIEGWSKSHANQDENAYGKWSYTLEAVPEPGTMIALGAGLAGLAASRRKRKR